MAEPTNAQLAASINNVLTTSVTVLSNYRDWLTGTHDGGPGGDGRYPLTDHAGTTVLTKCPARLQWEVDQTLTAADGAKQVTEDARDTVVSSETTITQHKDAAEQARTGAEQERQLADNAKSHAQNSEANARVHANTALSAASAMSGFDPNQPWQASLAMTSAIIMTSLRQLKQIIKDNPL